MTRLILALSLPWSPEMIGAFLFAGGLALGLLFCTGGCSV